MYVCICVYIHIHQRIIISSSLMIVSDLKGTVRNHERNPFHLKGERTTAQRGSIYIHLYS